MTSPATPPMPRRRRMTTARWAVWLTAAGGQGLFLGLFLHANWWEVAVTILVLGLLNEVMKEARL